MSTESSDHVRQLALSVYETVFREAESFQEANVGADLAYLLGAILKNAPDEARLECERNGRHEAILSALTDAFPPSHPVWTFIQSEPPVIPTCSTPARRAPKTASKVEVSRIDDALSRCTVIETKSLEEFLDSMLDEDLDVLAQLPGTPGQVLTAQFAYYVRSSVDLTEALKRDKAKSKTLIETIHRLPEIKKRRRNSRSPDHDPASSDPEAAA